MLKLAWRNIWRNKRRSFITMGMIMLAVVLSVFMRSMQLGTYDKMIDGMVRYTTGYIKIQSQGYQDEPSIDNSFQANDTLFNELKAIKGISSVTPRLETFALGSSHDNTKGLSVIGIVPEEEDALIGLSDRLQEGELINSEGDGVLIASGVAKTMKLGVGDTLVLLGSGYHGQTAAGKYPVRGVIKISNPQLGKRLIYLPLKKAQFLFGVDEGLSSYTLNIDDLGDLPRMKEKVLAVTNLKRYEVFTWEELLPELVQTIKADSSGGVIFIFILYMVITFGIFGTVLMLTAERTYEFGVLISIGMKRLQLGFMMVMETVIMSLLGVFFGLILSFPFVYVMHLNPVPLEGQAGESMIEMGLEPQIFMALDFGIAMNQAIIVFAIAVLLSIYPFVKQLFLQPVKAMRK